MPRGARREACGTLLRTLIRRPPMRRIFLPALVAAFASAVAHAQSVPAGYPADYAQVVAAAKKEGKVVIYSALDTKAAQPLVKDFNALFPNIKGEYNDMNSTEL